MSFLAPLFFAGLAALAVPILVHLIQRERKDVVEFPSLMFIRQIPYQSVERRRVHNWLLLMLRAAAMALLVAAFTRPFLTQDPVSAATALDGAREVVILLDHSASMGYGDRFERARTEARRVIESLGGEDRATLVLFGNHVEETVRATPDKAQLLAAVDAAGVTSEATRYGQPLRFAQSLLTRSAMPRLEAVLISDFQRSGWDRQEDIRLPEHATLTPLSVADPESANIGVSSVAFQHEMFSGQERVTITAGVVNRSARDLTNEQVALEINGRPVDSRPVSIGPNASGSVTFPPVTLAEANMRGTVRAGTDEMPADNAFHFALSPSRPVSALVVQQDGTAVSGPRSPSVYLTTALESHSAPTFDVDVMSAARVTTAALEGRSVVVLNNPGTLPSPVEQALERFVEQGGGVFVALADRSPWRGASPLLPGGLGQMVDRRGTRGTLGFLDYSHPVLEPFKDPRNGTFANVRFLRYVRLTPAEADKVLARFDDGAAALVERQVGAGRVVAFTSTIDNAWNDFPVKNLFPVVLPAMLGYLAQYEEPDAWYTVGRMMDISMPVGSLVREGGAGDVDAARRASGVVVSPSGEQAGLGDGGSPAVELSEQGFYSVRLQGTEGRPFAVAVNLDPAESDLSTLSPNEFVAAATGQAAVTAAGQSLERPEFTPTEIEKRQAVWWFLLVLAVGALLAESVLANRLSRGQAAGQRAGAVAGR
jgi:hypothetical protein